MVINYVFVLEVVYKVEARITQFKTAAEDASLTVAARAKEATSLSKFLHKHQNDNYTGPSRAALFSAIEQHFSRSLAGSEAVHLLLECALKMPEKIFEKAHKMRFLKWLERAEGAAGESSSSSSSGGEQQQQQQFTLVDVDTTECTLTLSNEDGSLCEEVVVVAASTATALLAMLEKEQAVSVTLQGGKFLQAAAAPQ